MKKSLIIFIIPILFISILELISNFIYTENNYDKITKILTEDPELIWIMRPNIHTEFESKEISINSYGFRNPEIGEKEKKRIIIMGASPSFGWGIEEEKTYAGLLQKKLRNYEIINASVIGYSSFQGKLLFNKIIKYLKPDIVVFAYGVNDPDRYRFFRNENTEDKNLKPQPFYITKILNFIRKSNILKLVSNYAIKWGLLEYSINTSKRVNLDDFIKNIDYFRKESLKSNFKLILLGFPFLKPPYCDIYSKCNELEIKKCLGFKKISYESFQVVQKLQLCKTYEDAVRYNFEMKKYAEKNLLDFIDLYNIFKGENSLFLNPEKDMVHFSEEGHRKISEILYRKIKIYETKNTFNKSKL